MPEVMDPIAAMKAVETIRAGFVSQLTTAVADEDIHWQEQLEGAIKTIDDALAGT